MGWSYIASNGALGGVLVIWDKRGVENLDGFTGEYMVACYFKNFDDNFLRAFAGVYGPNLDCDRRFLWEELIGLSSCQDVSRCIDGDFNVTRYLCEIW